MVSVFVRYSIALGMIACGPSVGDPADGNEGSGGSSSTTNASSSSSSVATSDPDSSEASTSVQVACEQYLDDVGEATPVTVRFVNDGDEPIVLAASCFPFDYLEIHTDSGLHWPGAVCGRTCEEEFISGCLVCFPCAAGSYTVLMPGGSVETTWPGVLFELLAPPEECFAMGSCGGHCERARIEIAEVVSATAAAISYEVCLGNATDPSACSCDGTLTCETADLGFAEPDLQQIGLYEPGAAGPIQIIF